MNRLRFLARTLAIALVYFLLTVFAVSAIAPEYAIEAGLVGVILAMLFYAMLVYTGTDEEGPALGLLALAGPAACGLIGVLWWIAKLFGLWG